MLILSNSGEALVFIIVACGLRDVSYVYSLFNSDLVYFLSTVDPVFSYTFCTMM